MEFEKYVINGLNRISPQLLEEENSSNWNTVTSGVPQGSILGPLLFLIYINDLPYGIHHDAKTIMYADDTSILLTARSDELKIKINSALDNVIKWFSVNGLVLNIEKTNIVKFTSGCCQNNFFQATCQNNVLIGANNNNFLGLELDKNIT